MFAPFSRRSFLESSVAAFAAPPILTGAFDDILRKDSESTLFQPDTLFLTWQRDPTTTMTVQWIGARGETADTKVYYAQMRGGSIQTQPTQERPYPMTDLKVYRGELTGLKPDTDYQFRIGKNSPVYRFRTMPARATDSLQFISGGDVGVNSHSIANNIQAARQDPAFGVVGGDLGYDNGVSVPVSLTFIRNWSKHMVGREGRLIPLIPCIGNHEVAGGYNKPRSKAPFFYALFDGLFRETGYASLDFGDYLSLVLLDTGHTSPIGGAQADWLDRTLKARADHPNVMVVNHVPAYPSFRKAEAKPGKADSGTGTGNRKYWVPLFEKHRVPIVLEHHDHTFKRTKPLLGGLAHDNGVLYLGDGSWGRLRSPNSPEKLSYLAKSSRDYHLTLHRIQGEERYHLALDENGRVMDITHTGQRKKGLVRVGG
jgi:acid phosphatase type 7